MPLIGNKPPRYFDETLGVWVHRYDIGSYTCRCGERVCPSRTDVKFVDGFKTSKHRGRPCKEDEPPLTIEDWKL